MMKELTCSTKIPMHRETIAAKVRKIRVGSCNNQCQLLDSDIHHGGNCSFLSE
jgi:hypothetical protein